MQIGPQQMNIAHVVICWGPICIESNSERDANLSRFQGSNSISSDMYFNRDTVAGSGAMRQSQSYGAGFQAPDMDDVKESVRQGVTKVAGRLSGMASGVMSSIQDKYGY